MVFEDTQQKNLLNLENEVDEMRAKIKAQEDGFAKRKEKAKAERNRPYADGVAAAASRHI